MFEQKSLEDDAIGITYMFEVGGPILVMGRRLQPFGTSFGMPFFCFWLNSYLDLLYWHACPVNC